MIKVFGVLLVILCLTAHSQDIEAQSAGLNFQTYAAGGAMPSYTQGVDGTITNRTLVSTGTVSTVNYQWGGGAVLNSGRNEGVIVRFYGFINIPAAGTYSFGGQADDGIRIKVNDVQVVDSWIESGGAFRSGSVTLPAGVVPIELIYYENGGGAMVNLQWLMNGAWQIIPSSVLATDSTYFAPAPPPTPTPVYGPSGITTLQQAQKTSALNQNPNGHNAVVIVDGDDNLINIQQVGGNGHYANVNLQGNVNTVDIQQTTTTASRHYINNTVTGNNNNITLKQNGTAKTQLVQVNGNNNTINAEQKDTGNHFLNLDVAGNNHTIGILQQGGGNHNANVVLNGSQPWNFNLNQSGSTSQNYSLPHGMTDGGTVSGTCSAIGGCNLTVNQQ